MGTDIFVFRPNEPQPQQKSAERESRVLADPGFPHHRLFLVDGLGGDSQRQGDVGPHLPGVEGALKASPLQGAPVEHRVEVEGVIPCPAVMHPALVRSLVPLLLQLLHGEVGGHFADLLQHRFSYFLTPPLHTVLMDLEGFEQDVLLGVHDGQGVLQALGRVVGRVHMDVHPTAGVHHRPGPPERPHYSLELSYLAVLQHRGVHLHMVQVPGGAVSPIQPAGAGGDNAGVVDEAPLLSLLVRGLPGVVGAGFPGAAGAGAEKGRHRLCRLLPSDARHFDLTAETLVFQVNGSRSPPGAWRRCVFQWPPPQGPSPRCPPACTAGGRSAGG